MHVMIRKFVGALAGAFLLAASCPAHTLTFHWSFAGVEGFITLPHDNQINQFADSVTVTVSPIGGLGEYVVSPFNNEFDVLGGAVQNEHFVSIVGTHQLNILFGTGTLQLLTGDYLFGDISYSRAAETPLPAALPLFASGLGALGLFGWCRKKKAQAAA